MAESERPPLIMVLMDVIPPVPVPLRHWTHTPTVSIGITCAVVCTYGCDDDRIAPTRCAIIDAELDGRESQCRAYRNSSPPLWIDVADSPGLGATVIRRVLGEKLALLIDFPGLERFDEVRGNFFPHVYTFMWSSPSSADNPSSRNHPSRSPPWQPVDAVPYKDRNALYQSQVFTLHKVSRVVCIKRTFFATTPALTHQHMWAALRGVGDWLAVASGV